jgi:hypothetical protein
MATTTIEDERTRRMELWADLEANKLSEKATADDLRRRRIYGGAQGIWVDKQLTSGLEGVSDGATVSLLHTGRHYPDDLSDDGVIYHYPRTGRGGRRDQTERADFRHSAFRLASSRDTRGVMQQKSRRRRTHVTLVCRCS